MVTEKKQEEKKERFEFEEVPTQTGIFIRDNDTGTIMDDKEAIRQLLNAVFEIKKGLV